MGRRRRRKMSRPIKLTQELIDECRQDFEKALSLTKLSDGKLSFTKAFSCGDKKAVYVQKLQAENAKCLDIVSFLCGKKIAVGTVLGQDE